MGISKMIKEPAIQTILRRLEEISKSLKRISEALIDIEMKGIYIYNYNMDKNEKNFRYKKKLEIICPICNAIFCSEIDFRKHAREQKHYGLYKYNYINGEENG